MRRMLWLKHGRDDATAAHVSQVSPPPGDSQRNNIIAARNEFSNAFGNLARGKRNWQLMAMGQSALLLIVTVAYVRLVGASRVVPYIVRVDKLGQIASIVPADALRTPDDRLIASELARFVRAVRTVLPAAASTAQADMIRRGYALAAPDAAGFLNDYFATPKNDPRVLANHLTREVEVTGALRMPKSNVWRLQWVETERPTGPDGTTRQTTWEGYVTVQVVPPTTTETIQDNPLGVYVTSISWTQLGDTALPDSAAASTDQSSPRTLSASGSGVTR